MKNRLNGLDTLRALAIAMVMLYHLNGRLPESVAWGGKVGWMGVDLFFVLSGYLIGSQLLRPVHEGRPVSLKDFYHKRAYRILPAYLVVLAVYVAWPAGREANGMSPLWEFLTFTENLFVNYAKNQAFSHVWSLCVEEHFYLVLPLLVLWLSRRASVGKTVAVMLLFVALGIAMRSYALVHVLRRMSPEDDPLYGVRYIESVYYPTWARLDGLIAGVGLALVRIFRPTWWVAMTRWASAVLVGGVALVGCSVWMFYDRFDSNTGVAAASTVIGFPVMSLGMAMMVAAAADARCWFGRWRVPGARVVATLAFSLYLTHKEVVSVVNEHLPNWAGERTWAAAGLYVLSSLLVAAVLYLGVERPFLKLRDWRERRTVDVDVEARVEPAL